MTTAAHAEILKVEADLVFAVAGIGGDAAHEATERGSTSPFPAPLASTMAMRVAVLRAGHTRQAAVVATSPAVPHACEGAARRRTVAGASAAPVASSGQFLEGTCDSNAGSGGAAPAAGSAAEQTVQHLGREQREEPPKARLSV